MIHISDELVEHVRNFLGEDGIDFFSGLLKDHGKVDPVLSNGLAFHPVHLREGMQVRNAMRESGLCDEWDCNDFDGQWTKVVEKAIEIK